MEQRMMGISLVIICIGQTQIYLICDDAFYDVEEPICGMLKVDLYFI